MLETLISFVTGKIVPFKTLMYVIIVGAIFYGGYVTGHNAGVAACNTDKTELNRQISDLSIELAKEKTLVADTVSKMNVDAAKRIAEITDRLHEVEDAAKKKIVAYQVSYQKQTKELQDAKAKAINEAYTPSTPGVINTGGLWVYIEEGTCSRQDSGAASGDQGAGSAGANSGSGGTQCRLSPKTSVPLIQLASEADENTLQLNLCVKEHGVAVDTSKPSSNVSNLPPSPPSPPLN